MSDETETDYESHYFSGDIRKLFIKQVDLALLFGVAKSTVVDWHMEHQKIRRCNWYSVFDAVQNRERQLKDKLEEFNYSREKAKLTIEQTKREKLATRKLEKEVEFQEEKLEAEVKKNAMALKIKELEFKEKAGEYLLRKDVEKEWSESYADIRSILLDIANTLALELTNISDPSIIKEILSKHIKKALMSLANG